LFTLRFTRFVLVATWFIVLFALAPARAENQIVVSGTVLCRNDGKADQERPIEGLLVYLADDPSFRTLTGSSGLFELPLPKNRALNRSHVLVIRTGWMQEKSVSFSCFENRLRREGQTLFLNTGRVSLDKDCNDLTSSKLLADYLKSYRELANNDIRSLSKETSKNQKEIGVGTLALIVLTTTLAGGVSPEAGPPGGPPGTTPDTLQVVDWSPPGYSKHPLSILEFGLLSSNVGFLLAPFDSYSESSQWNPASLAFCPTAEISLLGASLDYLRFASALPVTGNTGLGCSIRYLPETQDQVIRLEDGSTRDNRADVSQFAVSLGIGTMVGTRTSLGVGVEPSWYKREVAVAEISDSTSSQIIRSSQNETDIGVTLGFGFEVRPGWKTGTAIRNLLGGTMVDNNGSKKSARQIGLGTSKQYDRLFVGLEALYYLDFSPQYTAGLAFSSNSWLKLQGGVASEPKAWQAGLDVSFVRVSYAESDDWPETWSIEVNYRF
jgi:F plasmid transfer operon, TraF, protein